MYRIVCSDGVERHGSDFPTARAARQASAWAWCYLSHQIIPLRPDLADGTTAGVTDQPADRPPLAPAPSFASVRDVHQRIREAREDVMV